MPNLERLPADLPESLRPAAVPAGDSSCASPPPDRSRWIPRGECSTLFGAAIDDATAADDSDRAAD